jgi:hypothetical protein
MPHAKSTRLPDVLMISGDKVYVHDGKMKKKRTAEDRH